MSTETDIPTDFEALEEPFDDGVERGFRAEETYVLHGERIERETEIRLLEDGGVHITQKIPDQNVFDSLTLNGAVAQRLRSELEGDA